MSTTSPSKELSQIGSVKLKLSIYISNINPASLVVSCFSQKVQVSGGGLASLVDEVEERTLVHQHLEGLTVLNNLTGFHHQDSIKVNDSAEAMGDAEDGASLEVGSDSLLDELVGNLQLKW
jgi:hypothetical protein